MAELLSRWVQFEFCTCESSIEVQTKRAFIYLIFTFTPIVINLLTIPVCRIMTPFSSISYEKMNKSRLLPRPIATRFFWMWYAPCFYQIRSPTMKINSDPTYFMTPTDVTALWFRKRSLEKGKHGFLFQCIRSSHPKLRIMAPADS